MVKIHIGSERRGYLAKSAKSESSRRGENPRPTVLVVTRVKFNAKNRFSPDEKRESKIVLCQRVA